MNKKLSKIILISMFFIGLSILIYPFISQYYNSFVQTKVVSNYNNVISTITSEEVNNIFLEAEEYNNKLLRLDFPLIQYKEIPNYMDLVNINNNGMIGYISIEKIKVELPIYHGTSSSTLNVAVGHLEGSSLPIGGLNTHSVLSAHRGLPSSKLFTNLNKLEIGDTFIITVVDRKLTYRVDDIKVIEPNDVESLEIINDKDYVTLMTCTPYGINTHRLLVRGIRIENENIENIIINSEAYKIDKFIVTLIIAVPILIVLIIYVMIKPVKNNFKEEL